MNLNISKMKVICASICFGMLGLFARKLFSYNLSVGEVLSFRFLFASLILAFYFLIFDRGLFFLKKKDLFISFIQGLFGYAVFSSLYFMSIKGISISLAAILLFTYPLWITVLHLIFRESVKKSEIISALVAFLGIILLLWGKIEVNSLLALFCGLGAGFTYAVYVFISGKIQKTVHPLSSSFYVITFATLGLFLFHQPNFYLLETLNSSGWMYFIALSLVGTIIPLTLVLSSLQKLKSTTVSIISVIEPVTATLISIFVIGDSLTINQFVGAGIIFSAISINNYFESQS